MVEPSPSAVRSSSLSMPIAAAAASRPAPKWPRPWPTGAPVGQALALDHLGHAVRQLGDGSLEALGGGRDHGVDHGLDVDVVGLGDLSDRLALLEGGPQLVLADADRLGGDGELDTAMMPGRGSPASRGRSAAVLPPSESWARERLGVPRIAPAAPPPARAREKAAAPRSLWLMGMSDAPWSVGTTRTTFLPEHEGNLGANRDLAEPSRLGSLVGARRFGHPWPDSDAVPTEMLTQARPVAPRPDAPDVDPVGTKLARLEAKPALDIDEVDYDVRDPDAVRARLAAPLAYSQRVEAMVTGLSIETLLPAHRERRRLHQPVPHRLDARRAGSRARPRAPARRARHRAVPAPAGRARADPQPARGAARHHVGSHARDRRARVPLDRRHERAPRLLRLRADVGDPHRAR